MYLFSLNKDQGEKFLSLALTIINSDGEFSHDEKFIFSRIQQELGIMSENKTVEYIEGDSLDVFDTQQAKNTCVLELINLAYADGKFCENEKQFISHICENFDISQTNMNKMDQWVVKSLEVISDGAKLITELK